jgi:hypothetical protein
VAETKKPRKTGATGPKRTPEQLVYDRQFIADLYVKGVPQHVIRERLNEARPYTLSPATITNDLQAIEKVWLQSTLVDFNEARSKELARIDKLEQTYWEAWDRSCSERSKVKVSTRTGGTTPGSTDELATENRDGNPAFLQGVERCIGLRVKLLGLNELEHQQSALIKAYGGFDLDQL